MIQPCMIERELRDNMLRHSKIKHSRVAGEVFLGLSAPNARPCFTKGVNVEDQHHFWFFSQIKLTRRNLADMLFKAAFQNSFTIKWAISTLMYMFLSSYNKY